MGDWGLEDKYLRKNIPGRYATHWDKDSDEENEREDSLHGDSDAESEDDDPGPELPGPMDDPEPLRYGEAPDARGMPGAKGILAQHKYFKKMQYAERVQLADERQQKMMNIARGVLRDPNAPPPPPSLSERQKEAMAELNDDVGDDDDDDDSEDDEQFMADYRRMRIAALQATAGKPTFGTYRVNLSKEEYLEALNTDPRTVVVVHLYEPTYPPCRKINQCLDLIAPRRRDVSFVGMRLSEAGESCRNWDSEVLPVLVFYKGGQVQETLFQVGKDIGGTFDFTDIESVMDTVPCFIGEEGKRAPQEIFTIAADAPVATFHEGTYDDKKFVKSARGKK